MRNKGRRGEREGSVGYSEQQHLRTILRKPLFLLQEIKYQNIQLSYLYCMVSSSVVIHLPEYYHILSKHLVAAQLIGEQNMIG